MSIGQNLESGNMRRMINERDNAVKALEGRGVSVIIPCFEQQEWLFDALLSVTEQTVLPLEIIVVDDGSREPIRLPGGNRETYAPYTMRVIRVANRGLPSARNVGLMNAHGHAILPLDADDWLEPTFIEKTLPLLDAGADVVFTGLQEHGERTGTYMPGCDLGLDGLTVEAERLSNRLFYCSLISTSLLKEAGGWNGRMINGYEDWDLWIDLMQRGAKLAGVDEPLFNYRTRKDSMLADTEANWRDWCFDEMARHHGYPRPQPLDRSPQARRNRQVGRRNR